MAGFHSICFRINPRSKFLCNFQEKSKNKFFLRKYLYTLGKTFGRTVHMNQQKILISCLVQDSSDDRSLVASAKRSVVQILTFTCSAYLTNYKSRVKIYVTQKKKIALHVNHLVRFPGINEDNLWYWVF